jgi:MFS family permease
MYLVGWTWMAIWSLGCGLAHNVVLFDLAGGMIGIGSGALDPNVFALLARAFPPLSTKKNITFAFLGFLHSIRIQICWSDRAVCRKKIPGVGGLEYWAIGCVVLDLVTFVIVPHRIDSRFQGWIYVIPTFLVAC